MGKKQRKEARPYEELSATLSRIASTLKGDDAAAVEEAADIIHDYVAAAQMSARLSEYYETPATPTKRGGGIYYCPACCRRIGVNNEHCHWCGKLLQW